MRTSPLFRTLPLAALTAATALAAPAAPELHEPRLLVEAPSEVVVGEPTSYSVLLQEEWGREGPWLPTAGIERAMRLEVLASDPAAELEPRVLLERTDRGRRRIPVVFRTPGLQRIEVVGDAGISGRSNPVRVLPASPGMRVFWGDLHGHLHTPGAGHTGPMDPGEYARILAEGLAFARDASRLDFAAFTEHIQTAGGLAVADTAGRSPWSVTLEAVEAAHEPGRFVTFPGFEWQGEQGDHCVIYPGPGPLEAPAGWDALVASVRARGALLTAHAVFLPDTFEDAPDALAAIEVTRDTKSTEWLGRNAMANGVIRPFLGCSDTHGGALGATSLTGVRAAALDRASILEAIRAGRCWATNGERIVLDVRVDATGPLPRIDVRGVGTAPVDRIEILRNGEIVADARGFDTGDAFAFAWEDDDLLHADCIAGAVSYHARVVQTSTNRYDPTERDLAVSSPVAVTITPRHVDAAHGRRGGARTAAPGAALELVRAAWETLRAADGRPLAAAPRPGAELPAWSAAELAALRTAVRSFERLAQRDTTLVPLARALAALPEVAEAVSAVARTGAAVEEARATTGAVPARVAALRADVERMHVAVQTAEARLRDAGGERAAVARAWFAPRVLEDRRLRVDDALTAYATLPERSRPAVRTVGAPVTAVTVPVDPRIAAEVRAVEARESELQALHEKAWGYTAPSAPLGAGEPAMRVRVVAEGRPEIARLVGGGIDAGSPVPFTAARDGWVALLDRRQVPVAGEAPLEIRLDRSTVVSSVFLESPRGAPLREWGRVSRLEVRNGGDATRIVVHVEGGDVHVEIASGARVVWTGELREGPYPLALPTAALGDPDSVRVRWGFAGWRRVAGVEVPGHDVARALGFGALADGRAALALADGIVLVDPRSGKLARRLYPEGVRLDPGRTFCAAPCADGTVLRGASADGSWAWLLARDGEWRAMPPGPDLGSVVADGSGGLAWLVGNELHRRDAAGVEAPPRRLDATGRLLAIDAGGRALVRLTGGETVRADPADGRIVERLPASVFGVDAAGAALVLDGLDRRHAELATGAWVSRWPGDGSRSARYPWAMKASPTMDPPLACAPAPDGSLLVLGGAIGWRRGPENDWWGAQVELWEPAWVGEARP